MWNVKQKQVVVTGGGLSGSQVLTGLHIGGSGCWAKELANWASLRSPTGGVQTIGCEQQPEARSRRGSSVAGTPVRSCLVGALGLKVWR